MSPAGSPPHTANRWDFRLLSSAPSPISTRAIPAPLRPTSNTHRPLCHQRSEARPPMAGSAHPARRVGARRSGDRRYRRADRRLDAGAQRAHRRARRARRVPPRGPHTLRKSMPRIFPSTSRSRRPRPFCSTATRESAVRGPRRRRRAITTACRTCKSPVALRGGAIRTG